jgi:hypothetical protein
MVQIEIINKNSITDIKSDYLILKNTQEGNYGPEESVDKALGGLISAQKNDHSYRIGRAQIFNRINGIAANGIILVDIGIGWEMRYDTLDLLCKKAIETLSSYAPNTKSIATVSHGVGFGLDQKEVFITQLLSLKSAIEKYGIQIERIFFNEINQQDANKLFVYIEDITRKSPNIINKINDQYFLTVDIESSSANGLLQKAFSSSFVFVAIPFNEEFENTYDFGIRQAVESANLKPFRIDKEYYTGSIMNEIEKRIKEGNIPVLVEI